MHCGSRSRGLLILGLLLASGTPGSATTAQDLETLGFMSGCWRGTFGTNGVIEEIYSGAGGGLMVGTTRFLRDGQVVQFEFARVGVEEGKIVLTPYPNGSESEHGFRLTSFDGTTAIFEAPEHDYPKRIIYRDEPDGGRTASVDAGADDTNPRVWRMKRVSCPGAE